MFKKILVPTDGSALSEKAIHAAVEFARTNGSEIIALSVAEPYPYAVAFAEGSSLIQAAPEAFDEQMQELAQKNVDKVASLAQASKVPCKTMVALSSSPHEEIVRAATDSRCDVIFMASHGRKGLNKLFVGSETQKVLAHSTLPVLVFR
jgi:nucleotide-binding universal stress UspA family protein